MKPVLRLDSATPRYIYNWGTKGVAVRYYCEIGVKLDGVRAYQTPIQPSLTREGKEVRTPRPRGVAEFFSPFGETLET